MTITFLSPDKVGLPKFEIDPQILTSLGNDKITLFDLSSHLRAREAMEFGLKMRHMDFHVFVVGDSRSGRMTATLEFLSQQVKKWEAPSDWVYLNNFKHSHRPVPFKLQNGMAIKLKRDLEAAIESIIEDVSKSFSHPSYLRRLEALTSEYENAIRDNIEQVKAKARSKGYDIDHTPEGFIINPLSSKYPNKDFKENPDQQALQDIKELLSRVTAEAQSSGRRLAEIIYTYKRGIGEKIISPFIGRLLKKYGPYLEGWIADLSEDILSHIDLFATQEAQFDFTHRKLLDERYAVNILINNAENKHPIVLLESNPSTESMFGSIKYRTVVGGGFETNFTMIRPGALHEANEGILVVRAEALVKNPEVWEKIKVALNDRVIEVEERYRDQSIPLLDAPEPIPVPLNIQIFIVGSPYWFYMFFYNDPDFGTHFKVKADIDSRLSTTKKNLTMYSRLLYKTSVEKTGLPINRKAIEYMLGYSSRWIGDRKKLSAKFELLTDILIEASTICHEKGASVIATNHVITALKKRNERSARLEDRTHEMIDNGTVLIKTSGSTVGQINGLSVITTNDHSFGVPNRITAQTYAGKIGIINIERLTRLSGPIQQKGAFILDGFLNGLFAQQFPVSCSCSLTFEQNYDGIEGDSASVAELLAILSSLSGLPLKQNIAVTGSLNQKGIVQAVGGVTQKVEGFFRVCNNRGLNGTYGVIVPYSNENNIILHEDLVKAVKAKKFFIYPVKTIEQAIKIMMDRDAGKLNVNGEYTKDSVYDLVMSKLRHYNEALTKKRGH